MAGLNISSDTILAGGSRAFLDAAERGGGVLVGGKVSYTIDQAALQLTGHDAAMQPYAGWGGVVGQAYTVTYAYRASAPTTMPSDAAGFQRFTAAQITQTDMALQAWSDVANITFVRVGQAAVGESAYSNFATILFGGYTSGEAGAAAFSMFPGNPNHASADGDVWVNATYSWNLSPAPGSYGAHTLVHEIGHAIGLTHPGDYNAENDATITYAADAEYYEDSNQYTVMSYFDEWHTGGDFGGRYSAVPLLDDIRAAQIEYGANMSTRAGDTIYGFGSTAGRPWFLATSDFSKLVFAVWDAGGRDTFNFSGYSQDQVIDLGEGDFSNVGGLVGNVAIAQGARIENAVGGSGADLIRGNALDNLLQGGAGVDSIFGGLGADTIEGGSGASYLRGEEGADSIVGGSGFDNIQGNTGSDTEHGGAGNDWVLGGKDNDLLFGDAGDDIINGNLGSDTVDGGDGADAIRGGQGDDVLMGGAGADFLTGDLGSDTVTGGAGADIFYSFVGAGTDRVLDFNAAEGDRVQLNPGDPWTVAQVGADTVVGVGAGDKLVLVGVTASSLPAGWIFGF